MRQYKDTRNGMLGTEYSSKFSPWLANGSLSARWSIAELRRHEGNTNAMNQRTGWVEMLWRDFFRGPCCATVARYSKQAVSRLARIQRSRADQHAFRMVARAPACRWWMPICASWPPPALCPTAVGRWLPVI